MAARLKEVWTRKGGGTLQGKLPPWVLLEASPNYQKAIKSTFWPKEKCTLQYYCFKQLFLLWSFYVSAIFTQGFQESKQD